MLPGRGYRSLKVPGRDKRYVDLYSYLRRECPLQGCLDESVMSRSSSCLHLLNVEDLQKRSVMYDTALDGLEQKK